MEVNTTTTTDPMNMYNYANTNTFSLNPIIIILIVLVFVAYFVLFSSLGNDTMESSDSSSNTQKLLKGIVIIIVVLLVFVNAFQYFFSMSITAYLKNIFSEKPEVDIVVDQSTYEATPSPSATIPEIQGKKQVFNIPGNTYTYDSAKALCTAYGADLASYQQVEDAYKRGGEWCNYGWSDGQMALFPTQQTTFDNLQKIPGHEHDCGRPGINGGYMANPNLRFGVNCYGHKPRITQEEDELMKVATPYPETKEDMVFQKKVDYWKNHIDQILVSPFNYNNWTQV